MKELKMGVQTQKTRLKAHFCSSWEASESWFRLLVEHPGAQERLRQAEKVTECPKEIALHHVIYRGNQEDAVSLLLFFPFPLQKLTLHFCFEQMSSKSVWEISRKVSCTWILLCFSSAIMISEMTDAIISFSLQHFVFQFLLLSLHKYN